MFILKERKVCFLHPMIPPLFEEYAADVYACSCTVVQPANTSFRSWRESTLLRPVSYDRTTMHFSTSLTCLFFVGIVIPQVSSTVSKALATFGASLAQNRGGVASLYEGIGVGHGRCGNARPSTSAIRCSADRGARSPTAPAM